LDEEDLKIRLGVNVMLKRILAPRGDGKGFKRKNVLTLEGDEV
jgi:hypothetical protein